ncbi:MULTISPECIES: dethiobiotin synthase [unclassified Crossiella]|uniref:dethiobiotin synthase n=1 Tax=unclassified Crossiella TaxID=2620835 RepID=UPI001FFF5B16|nr:MULTISPECIES: dethiobiotin synthase [unclassified Crossiella]MCK2240301.1 dethiobiotin synthase [Crossiella sp. S99.2]MCK2253247.1 dethiobiotin synthase [Crossiella sp. S99.1]
MTVLVITGTGTEVGKTVVTAAVAALARAEGKRVAVLKPAQTGVGPNEPGDIDEVVRLTGAITARELARYPQPLAPATAARAAGMPPVRPAQIAAAATGLDADHDLVLLEGAGGLLVRFDTAGSTLADAAWALGAPVLLVASAGLGVLNTATLTVEALRRRGLICQGLVVGSWPHQPDLACRHNLADLPEVTGVPLLGVLPEGAGKYHEEDFLLLARRCLAPELGGEFDAAEFTVRHGLT